MNKYRKYMLLTYSEMLKSNNFHNNEQYQAPLVGCLLLYSDGTFITSYRDESSVYKHAENILIHKMDKNKINNQAILFVTLEPCVPFVKRNHLLSCSELIVQSSIKKVCIGMIDPNPNISNKGIQFLMNHSIQVTFFDKDIAKKIIKANKNFIEFIKKEKHKK